ncbi:hypothetical protein AMJ47_01685 [Parcubacteria bacterium DG_72]|nr:MAG: hypothetical protein AMJ47_01685 [Parcubacteria bacterium DG_72]
MISVFIMLLLLLLSFPFYTSINKQLTIDRAATKLVRDIRKVQELAMSAQEHYDINTEANIIPDNGYGIFIEEGSSEYHLFADYEFALKNNKCDFGKGELVETVSLEKGIQVESTVAGIANIIFLAPDPSVTFANAGGKVNSTASESIITLSDGTRSVTIKINRAGLVYIE